MGKITRVEITGGSNVDYTYDEFGNRSKKSIVSGLATYYLRDQNGVILAMYTDDQVEVVQSELHIQASSTVGIIRPYSRVEGQMPTGDLEDHRTNREYQLTNHLGNVLTTITDRRLGMDTDADNLANYYTSEIAQAQDYYPFGMMMSDANPITPINEYSGRTYHYTLYQSNSYRFAYNGKEVDADMHEEMQQLDYGFRVYNAGLGRFLSVDPLSSERTWVSPYNYVQNNPINRIDPSGALDSAYTVNIDNGTITKTGSEGGNEYDVITYVNNTPIPQIGAVNRTEIIHSGGGQRLGPGEFAPAFLPAQGSISSSFSPLEVPLEIGKAPLKAAGFGMMALVRSLTKSRADDLPDFVYHYTSKEAAEFISTSQLGRHADDLLYLTPNGKMTALQAQLELALPRTNTAQAVFKVNTAALNKSRIEMIRRVTGNVLNRPGGGTELLYRGTIDLSNFTRVK